ncbi:enoyl-CoA hydratase-related protein [Oceaniglobus ichthyenteri]|uniref:enoyl-CoA hydratase-related protein n=1 Tax=Oceaniglobus ichthyenteri TaxID=2136177 RepID=UPI000D3AF4C6|nr:enoyl-CoA hydratase-related protein [Oceaniglobus ichthyenteri]
MDLETNLHGDVAVIHFANPPSNAMTGSLRAALAAAVTDAIKNDAVRALILTGDGGDFCTGADHNSDAPGMMTLCRQIQDCPKPVIVALQGAVLGDGLDLALACHFRVGGRDTRIGAPGIRLGLPPRGGATQRLPRLCGAAPALSLLMNGAERAPFPGFLDAPFTDDPLVAALEMAKSVADPRPTSQRRDGLSDPNTFMAAVARARTASAGSPLDVAERIVACVEAAMLLPMESGLAMEKAAYDDCAASPASRALRHLAGAESAAWALPEAGGGRAQPISRVAILGGTARAGELALSCLNAGLEVLLIELETAGQAIVLERLLSLYDDAVDRGSLTAEQRDARLLRVQPEASFDDLNSVDVVWEAAVDDLTLRQELWAAITLLARPGALLIASGDTVAPIDLAGDGARLDDMVGLHIPGAAHVGPLAELCPAPGARPDTVATALALVRRLQRQVVRGADQPGRLVHHLSEVFERTIETLLIAGLSAEDIDAALMDYGFRHPPCATLDMRGLDRVLAHRKAVHGTGADELGLLDALVDCGLTGRRAGAGLLQWSDDTPIGETEDTRALMAALAEAGAPRASGVARRDIAHVCAAALANAGAHMLDSGLIGRAGDVDVAAVHRLGFPRWRGGPMMAADLRGLVRVEQDLALAGAGTPISPLFDDCIKNGTPLSERVS